MKKNIGFFVSIILLVFCLSFAVLAENGVKVTLNGAPIDCASYGQEAEIVEGRTLVPLRAIFESLGASVEWNQDTKTVTSTLGDITIRLTIGENKLYRNSEAVEIDVPAKIMNGRTMVPARAVAESFGVSVGWSAQKRTVVLMTVPDEPVAKYNADMEKRLSMIVPGAALDNEILGTVGGLPLSGAAVRYATMYAINNVNLGMAPEKAAAYAEGIYRQNAALISLAYKNRITLTDEEIETTAALTLESLKKSYGNNVDMAFSRSPYTKNFYFLNTVYSVIYDKIAQSYRNDRDSEFMTQLESEVYEYLLENNYVRAKHILVMFPEGEGEDGSLTDEQRKATLEKANSILKEVNSMSDISEFDALVKKYNQDPGMESYPGGYYFTKNEMVKPFEETTYNLKEGQVSGIVETNYGYHIILRLPLEDEALYDSDIYQELFGQKLLELIVAEGDSLEVVYAENYDERVKDFDKEYYSIFS